MDEEKTTTQEQESEGAQTAGAETAAETVTEAEKTTTENSHEAGDPEPAEKKPAQSERHFTQAEVDEIVKKRLARAAKDSQTAAQMQQTIEAENAALRHSVACYQAGVRAECVEDAVALASKYVDDKTDFNAALTKVLEKYPSFAGQTVKNSSVDMTPKKSEKSDDALRSAMGIYRKDG